MADTARNSALAERIEQAQVGQANPGGARLLELVNSPKLQTQIAQALPRHMDAGRFVRVVVTELRRHPQLLQCTPQSFLGALLEASALGLEPGPLGHCYLLPFRNRDLGTTECQLILGYKGMIDMARRSGNIENIVARAVYEKDDFDFQYGLAEHLDHRPFMDGDRGAAKMYYGVAQYKGGGHLIMVLSKADVDRYRSRSKAKNSGPWVTDYEAMALKTVVRRMATFMPLSVQAASAVAIDEQRELGLDGSAALTLDVDAVTPLEPTAEDAPPEGDPAVLEQVEMALD